MKNISIIILGVILVVFCGCNDNESGSSARPASPSDLIAEAISTSKIKLIWTDNSYIEDGFVIMRSTEDSGYEYDYNYVADLMQPDVTEYIDTDLSIGTTYYYMVKAYNGNVYSYPSNIAEATTFIFMIRTGSSGGHPVFVACGCLGIEPLFIMGLLVLLKRRLKNRYC